MWKINKRKQIFGCYILIIILICSGCENFLLGKSEVNLRMKSYSEIVFNPFSMDISEARPEQIVIQKNGMDYVNYWVQASVIITKIHRDMPMETWKPQLDQILETFKRVDSFPRPQYKQFSDGWVSSMDAPVIALAAHMAFEKTGDIEYQEITKEIMKVIARPVEEGGFALYWEEKAWLLEYADKSTTPENAQFVLNGSLVGVLATKMLADTYDDQKLQQLLEKQVITYTAMKDQFFYADESYCYYMLSPKTVNQPHYVIFEIRLFDALAEVFLNTSFFAEEAQRRRNILLGLYPIQLSEQGENFQYTFMRGGHPHPYYIDIYTTKLQFLDSTNNTLLEIEQDGRDWFKDNWMFGDLPQGTEKVTWTVVTPFWEVKIGNCNIWKSYANSGRQQLSYTLKASDDATKAEDSQHNFLLDPDRSEAVRGTLQLTLPNINIAPTDFIVMEIDCTEQIDLSTNVVLYNSQGEGISRYLTSLAHPKSVFVFSLDGFSAQGEKKISDIQSMVLRFYTSDLEKGNYNFEFGNIYKFSNVEELRNYFNETDYTFDYGA